MARVSTDLLCCEGLRTVSLPHRLEFVLLGAFLAAKGAQTNQLHQRDPLGADRPAAAETTSRLRPTPQNKFPTPLANCFIFRLSAVKPSSSNAIENYRFPECQNSSAHCEGHFS